ncbi:MAG: F0F1 ATP synthase subunit B [Planctomycetota bacterium]
MLNAAILPLAAEGGFDPMDPTSFGGAIWTWIIFLVSLPFIWKVVMGPIANALTERDEHVARAIATAEKASAEAEAARAEVEVKLGEANADAARLLSEARERAEAREREMLDQAKQEAAAMVDSARSTIRAEQDKALATIRAEVVDLSLNAASKVLERNVASEDDRKLVGQLVGSQEGSEA